MKEEEIICKECKKISIPDRSKWGCEPDICDECLKIGWFTVNSVEGKKLLEEDMLLKKFLIRPSPYFKGTEYDAEDLKEEIRNILSKVTNEDEYEEALIKIVHLTNHPN